MKTIIGSACFAEAGAPRSRAPRSGKRGAIVRHVRFFTAFLTEVQIKVHGLFEGSLQFLNRLSFEVDRIANVDQRSVKYFIIKPGPYNCCIAFVFHYIVYGLISRTLFRARARARARNRLSNNAHTFFNGIRS